MYQYYISGVEQFDALFLKPQRILSFDSVSGFRIDVSKDITPYFKVSHSYEREACSIVDSLLDPLM